MAKEYKKVVEERKLNLSETSELRFNVTKGENGEAYLDIRTWLNTERYSGPTKKGITTHIENIEALIVILEDMAQEAEDNGV